MTSKEINVSEGQLLLIFCSLIKSVVKMSLSFEFVWEGKYVTIIWLYWHYKKIKIQTNLSEVLKCPFDTKLIFLSFFFFSEQCSYALKDFLASLSLTSACNLTPYIKLPAYVRTSCWSAKSILISVRHGFMKFMQIGI